MEPILNPHVLYGPIHAPYGSIKAPSKPKWDLFGPQEVQWVHRLCQFKLKRDKGLQSLTFRAICGPLESHVSQTTIPPHATDTPMLLFRS
jgi:hypothetical protein